MMNYMVTVAAYIRTVRTLFGWSQEKLGEEMGISRGKIVTLESNPTTIDRKTIFAFYMVVNGWIADSRNKLAEDKEIDLDMMNPRVFNEFEKSDLENLIEIFAEGKEDRYKYNYLQKGFGIALNYITKVFDMKDIESPTEFMNKLKGE